jgi:hypothetical protein
VDLAAFWATADLVFAGSNLGARYDMPSSPNCNAPELLMNTVTWPSLRVDPPLRDAAQSVRAEFVARGLASRESALSTSAYYATGDVHAELGQMYQQTSAKVQNQKLS